MENNLLREINVKMAASHPPVPHADWQKFLT
jgi:hypothetical protein